MNQIWQLHNLKQNFTWYLVLHLRYQFRKIINLRASNPFGNSYLLLYRRSHLTSPKALIKLRCVLWGLISWWVLLVLRLCLSEYNELLLSYLFWFVFPEWRSAWIVYDLLQVVILAYTEQRSRYKNLNKPDQQCQALCIVILLVTSINLLLHSAFWFALWFSLWLDYLLSFF